MKMKPITLEKIAEVTGGRYFGPRHFRNDRITGVSADSRYVEEGSLFVCIRGTRVDGHDFAKDAVEIGKASCRLAEKELNDGYPYVLVDSTTQAIKALAAYYRSLLTIPVIGIVGSVGKTTAKEMTADVLSRKFCVLKTPANLNNELGVPLTLLSICEEHEAAVIEMGISDFGEMRRLAEMVRPDICVMTSIGYCHLEKLCDLQGVLQAKSEVFESMEPDAIAVVNGDDAMLRDFDPGIRKVTFGLDENNDYRAENVENLGFSGISCDICDEKICVFTLIPAFGTHIVYGALAAAAVGRILGVDGEDVMRGIAEYRPVGGRANVIDTGYITVIDDCYNANPNSMSASLKSLCSLKGKRCAILGDMNELGSDSNELHRQMGVYAADKKIDLLICVGEASEHIYNGYISADGQNGYYFKTKEELYPQLPGFFNKKDIVLVKASHGMAFEDIVEELRKIK